MDRADEIFSLFENVCSTDGCGVEVRVINVGGTKEFFIMQDWFADLEVDITYWAKHRLGTDVIGSLEFMCTQGHKHTVEYGRWGEWL